MSHSQNNTDTSEPIFARSYSALRIALAPLWARPAPRTVTIRTPLEAQAAPARGVGWCLHGARANCEVMFWS